MISPGRGLFDDEFAEQGGGDGRLPFREHFPVVIEVEDFEVPGDVAADDAHGIVAVGEPGFDLDFGREPRLPGLPAPHGGIFLFPFRGENGETCLEVLQGGIGFDRHGIP